MMSFFFSSESSGVVLMRSLQALMACCNSSEVDTPMKDWGKGNKALQESVFCVLGEKQKLILPPNVNLLDSCTEDTGGAYVVATQAWRAGYSFTVTLQELPAWFIEVSHYFAQMQVQHGSLLTRTG